MHKYVIRRLLLAIPVLLLSSLIVFGLMRVMPGDALTALMAESGNVGDRELAKLRKELGLDRPYHEQYVIWLWQMVSFNPGYSIFTNEPISVALKKSIPVTIELATLAMILGLSIAIPVGVLSATRQDRPSDYLGRVVAVSGLSLPDFWLGTLVITFVTIVGGQLGTLLAGTVIVETIFALPGMGRLTVEAILFRDYPVVQTNVMLVAGTLVTLNLLVDLTYAWLDPRIHYR